MPSEHSGRLPPLAVAKLGGSLLDWKRLPTALRAWLCDQAPTRIIFVAGGGPFADVVRILQGDHRFSDEDAHWMAIAAMGVSARLLASLLELPRVAGADDCLAWSHGREPPACVLDVTAAIDGPSTDVVGQAIRRLPQDWSVTSDSIAAAVAVALDATHLHLLKSADPPGSATLNELARLRFVDGHLPRFAGQLNLHVTNLRRRA